MFHSEEIVKGAFAIARIGQKRIVSHAGHRERLRLRAAADGLDPFEPHEAVELLLFESIPRRNTNELAHRLTNNRLSDNRVDPEKGRDGTGALPALLKENPRSLAKTRGIGSASARLISSVLPRTAERMSTALCGRSLPGLRALLPAADLRLNGMGEAGAVLLFDADGLLTDWLPARDIKALLRLSENARVRLVPSWLVLIRKDAADRLCTDEREPDLSSRFPGAAEIGVLTPDRRMDWR